MDHLHIPPGCRPNMRPVPYLGIAPKYDNLGFDGFPERHGWTADELLNGKGTSKWRADYVESFLQEWLFFGPLDEFGNACKISIDLEDFITDSPSGEGKIISTSLLYDVYVHRLACKILNINNLALGLELDDLINLPYDPSTEDAFGDVVTFAAGKFYGEIQFEPTDTSKNNQRLHMLEQLINDKIGYTSKTETVPELLVLLVRIFSSRAFMNIVSEEEPLEDLISRARDVPRMVAQHFQPIVSRTQNLLRTIMAQSEPVVRIDVVICIDVLCHTLAEIILELLEADADMEVRSPDFSKHVRDIMVSRNWCPSRISGLANSINTPLLYMLSLLPSYGTESHGKCSIRKCVQRTLTLEAMPKPHREDCDQHCPLVTISEPDLIETLESGALPGLVLVQNQGKEEFQVVDCTNEPFIAISHVWSHGLGNDRANELHSCQLRFLFSLVKQLGGEDMILWIDTLVVPATNLEAKRIAISKLRRVYSGASKVLVIDKNLMQTGSDPTEQMAQLHASEWQSRLWTLQEGLLARELYVQFKHGAVAVSELAAPKPVTGLTSIHEHIDFYRSLKTLYMQRRFLTTLPPQSHFLALVENLSTRSVTVKTDEPICLATLLSLPLEDFDPYPTMADIYRSLSSIPRDLIFLFSQRLADPGLTWAPSTFLESQTDVFHAELENPYPAYLSEHGLVTTAECFLLDKHLSIPTDIPHPVYMLTSDNQCYAFKHEPLSLQEYALSQTGQQHTKVIENPAIIFETPHAKFTLVGSKSKATRAVLLSRQNRDSEAAITSAKFEMSVILWHVRDEHLDFHTLMLRDAEVMRERYEAELVSSGMRFCIG